jgi:hypothetical protein
VKINFGRGRLGIGEVSRVRSVRSASNVDCGPVHRMGQVGDREEKEKETLLGGWTALGRCRCRRCWRLVDLRLRLFSGHPYEWN